MMKRQYVFGVGLAVSVVAALGIGAPIASAGEVVPGISCDGGVCANDTDELYRVTGYGYCDGQFDALTQSIPPHSSGPVTCASGDAAEGFSGTGAYVPTVPF
jgi:hypothetical protein